MTTYFISKSTVDFIMLSISSIIRVILHHDFILYIYIYICILITLFLNHPAQWDPFYTKVQTQNAPESTSPRVPAESDCFHGFKQKSNNANAAQSHSFESFRKSMFNQTFERCQEQAIIFLRQRALILYIYIWCHFQVAFRLWRLQDRRCFPIPDILNTGMNQVRKAPDLQFFSEPTKLSQTKFWDATRAVLAKPRSSKVTSEFEGGKCEMVRLDIIPQKVWKRWLVVDQILFLDLWHHVNVAKQNLWCWIQRFCWAPNSRLCEAK